MRLFHILLIIVFIVLAFSGIVPSTILSKEAIIENIAVGAVMSDIVIAPADMLHVARMVRREMWDLHTYVGFVFIILVFTYLYLIISNRWGKYKTLMQLHISIFSLAILFQFTTGVLLFLRQFFEALVIYKEAIMQLHFLSLFLFVAIIFVHIYERTSSQWSIK
ncbi:MAG: cytochrome b/b6 domain-containing protein [Campylobacterales bacterium]|nr:cytochrome b/b6 domain-containing protein [Campylobacterales bacterium]